MEAAEAALPELHHLMAKAEAAPGVGQGDLLAEPRLDLADAPRLSGAALTEWRQRIAWSYYLNGDDANARLLQGAGE